jgi:phosphatidylserine/phosphatidylglycerophosphate/cardiolipin synthase-like enzyme
MGGRAVRGESQALAVLAAVMIGVAMGAGLMFYAGWRTATVTATEVQKVPTVFTLTLTSKTTLLQTSVQTATLVRNVTQVLTATVTATTNRTVVFAVTSYTTIVRNTTVTRNVTTAVTTTQTVTYHTTRTATVEVRPETVVCFSRVQDCVPILVGLINRANISVHVAVYVFTLSEPAAALVAAKRRGVDVAVVVERDNANVTGSRVGYLRSNNVTVVLDGNPYLMHHKFMVVDGEYVAFGSYNWSLAAEERNDEDLVVVRDRALAQLFEREFRRLLLEAGYG